MRYKKELIESEPERWLGGVACLRHWFAFFQEGRRRRYERRVVGTLCRWRRCSRVKVIFIVATLISAGTRFAIVLTTSGTSMSTVTMPILVSTTRRIAFRVFVLSVPASTPAITSTTTTTTSAAAFLPTARSSLSTEAVAGAILFYLSLQLVYQPLVVVGPHRIVLLIQPAKQRLTLLNLILFWVEDSHSLEYKFRIVCFFFIIFSVIFQRFI